MKVITLYELIGLIKDNKAPREIKYDNRVYEYDEDKMDYETFMINRYEYLLSNLIFVSNLNDEVEIIEEEKEIEEIDMCTGGIMGFDGVENITGALKDKINELVRELNKIKKEGK